MRRHAVRAVPIFLITALSIACGANEESSEAMMDAAGTAAPPPMSEMSRGVVGKALEASGGFAAPAESTEQIRIEAQPATVPSMIIRNGSASVEVDSLEIAIAAVQQMAAALGGYVGNTSLSAGEYQLRSASIELKIPAARYDEALAGLKPIGKVEAVSSTAEDVGEEFVDVTARVANAKRLEDRLVSLLATRTGKLEDVLAVERELARVRQEIERYEGRLRFLRTRVATSTLTVSVHERAPLVSDTPGESVLGNAFKDAWRNFVHFLAGFIASLGVLIPVAGLTAVAVLGLKRFFRRRELAPPISRQ